MLIVVTTIPCETMGHGCDPAGRRARCITGGNSPISWLCLLHRLSSSGSWPVRAGQHTENRDEAVSTVNTPMRRRQLSLPLFAVATAVVVAVAGSVAAQTLQRFPDAPPDHNPTTLWNRRPTWG